MFDEKSGKAAAVKMWGASPREPRAQIAVSKSVRDQFEAAVPLSERRARADHAILEEIKNNQK